MLTLGEAAAVATAAVRFADLLVDLRLDELGQVAQRFLPAEIAGLGGDGVRDAGLGDVDLGADRHFLQDHGHLDLARQIGIVEAVGVAQALARDELDKFATEGMAAAGGEVAEGHLVGSADLALELVHRAGKAVGGQPLRQRIRLDECAVDLLRLGRQNAVQLDGARHISISFLC
ncbi:conserved hypothetical protein [Mesorhizobium plurifarium]|uniref:Uncharacterized protein n=1 Tax=Mesorhizobium plurifarium TaxID=69974 RepID=A0A090FEZ8_MESPL|nr:conserved hypothetical protein [Mesorhizobium plurifarium]